MNVRWKIAQAAEIRWWQRYLKNKEPKAYLNWKIRYWQDLLQQAEVAPHPGERVLDAGCGPAGIFMVLQQQQVDALDPLLDRYASDLAHFAPTSYPHTRFHALPLEQFDAKATYDRVFCLNAINHVADLGLCFDRLIAATKPGGQLLVSIDAHNFRLLKSIFRLLPGDILHPHQYDLEEYQQMLLQRGCQIERTVLLKKAFIFDYYLMVARKGQ
ncbi:MAG: methyltransferase domain-containing protein [Bacteroidota bacterium]